MESGMLKIVKAKNPEKDYPSNMGRKWTVEEENLLLDELDKNMSIEFIAESHQRTLGGIVSRRSSIAYRMYTDSTSKETIMNKTKLNQEELAVIISKNDLDKDFKLLKKVLKKEKKEKKEKEEKEEKKEKKEKEEETEDKFISFQKEIIKVRLEIKEIKNTLNELVKMFKV